MRPAPGSDVYSLPLSVYPGRYVSLISRMALEGSADELIDQNVVSYDSDSDTATLGGTILEKYVASLHLPDRIGGLEDEEVIGHIMKLLRTKDIPIPDYHSKIFHSYIGFISINHFVLAILVGVLSRLDMLHPFIQLARRDTDKIITRTLSEVVAHELRSTMSPDGYGMHASSGVSLPLYQYGVLLPEIGGVKRSDLEYFFELVWNDRKGFIQLLSSNPFYAFGWSSIFCLIFKVFEKRKASTTGEQWAQLWYLLYRYRLFAPLVEEGLAQVLCSEIETRTRFHEFQGLSEIDGPFDEEDSRMVVRGYIKKMNRPGAEFPTSESPIQLMRVPYEAMHHMRVYELVAECVQATLPYTWVDIAALNEHCIHNANDAKNAVNNIHMHVCQVVTQFKEILDVDVAYITPEQRSEFLHALEKGDFIAVVSRALLASATYIAGRVKVDYGSSRVWRDMIAEIESVASILKKRYPPDGVSRIFSPSLSDILKTARQNELIYSLSEPTSHVYKFARDSKAVLEGLTIGFGIALEQDPIPEALPCAYSRCSSAHGGSASAWRKLLVCEECLSVEYCSRDCQAKDWTNDHPTSHSMICRALAEVGTRVN
ncbi:MYND finger protein [Rhizoctonia solani AG-3 Rhs1AP]|uniref:MYND finger protein n=1 Tax=Rhizoctonia solani AG-3 Rhs1AP TaxID=1086054 RepID=X8J031_9AGAM|nr:MYND finger protein [Rhizoctonia solani AG-3 Rhs1AP]